MPESIDSYIRTRAQTLGLNLSDVCRVAGMSRQTLYSLAEVPNKLPNLKTVVSLAEVLRVHPLRLLHLIFDQVPVAKPIKSPNQGRDVSAFVQDVTFPDGSLVLPNQVFVKTWEVQNVGHVPWEGRYLQCMDEEIVVSTRTGEVLQLAHNLRPTTQRVPVPFAKPGDSVDISVEFTAPNPHGTILSYWKSIFADGTLCFPKAQGLWVKVQVSSFTSGASE